MGQEPGFHPEGRASSVWQPGGPGSPLVGYFPEFVNSVQWHASELCNVADMIALAIRFSELELDVDCGSHGGTQ